MDPFDMIVSGLLIGIPLGYVVLQISALAKWSGASRLGAVIPVPLWTVWALLVFRDLPQDPTSHNLFPFEILIGSLLSSVYLGILAAARGFGRLARA